MILVVFLFLRSGRATIIPAVAVPVSLIGTFAAMYLCGFSLNNLSLMALTIATGFVVDDAIVVLENIARHLEAGMKPCYRRRCKGTREVGFTVLSMSLSLVAVFLPLLLMGGLPGRLLREFAVTLSVAIGISLLVSLTLTPMMCGWMLKASKPREQKRLRGFGRMLVALQQGYGQVAKMGAQSYPSGGRGAAWHHCAEYLAVYLDPENLLPGAGHRRTDGRDTG